MVPQWHISPNPTGEISYLLDLYIRIPEKSFFRVGGIKSYTFKQQTKIQTTDLLFPSRSNLIFKYNTFRGEEHTALCSSPRKFYKAKLLGNSFVWRQEI